MAARQERSSLFALEDKHLMRIALFSDVYKPVINGVVNHICLLKKYLEEFGEQIWLFVPGRRRFEDDEPNVIRIPGIPISDTGYHVGISIDHHSRELLKHVDVIHVHHPFVSGSFGLFFSNRYNVPMIFTSHSRYDMYVQQYLPRLPEAVSETAMHAFFQRFGQHCSVMIAPTRGIERIMRQWGVSGRIEVVPGGIELEQFGTPSRQLRRADLQIDDSAVICVYVGRLSEEKSVDRLIRIFASLFEENKDLHLLIVGDGPSMADCQYLVQILGISSRVTFVGSVPYTSVAEYFALADIFVSASVAETQGFTFVEAAAAGLPAVGIDAAGVNEMIVDATTGYLAKNNDLSFGLRVLRLAQDPDTRKHMGAAAQRHSSQFSAHANARRLLDIYRSVTEHS